MNRETDSSPALSVPAVGAATAARPTVSGEGEFEQWDAIWKGNADDRQLFTRGTCDSVRKLCQRGYFEDLIAELARLGYRTPGDALELGSGRGTTSMYLANLGWRVTLVDLAPEGLKLARENFARERLAAPDCVIGDARGTQLPEGVCDCVYNIGLLEHFDDPRPVLAEGLRLLRPGGLLFMVVVPRVPKSRRWLVDLFAPWRFTPRWARNLIKRILGRPLTSASTGMTRTEFSRDQYRRWLSELGAAEIRCLAYNPYHEAHLGRTFERWVLMPLFRAHHAFRRLATHSPYLRTAASLASCDLLLARKPAAPGRN